MQILEVIISLTRTKMILDMFYSPINHLTQLLPQNILLTLVMEVGNCIYCITVYTHR